MKPYIKSISAHGLKAGDFQNELGRVNLITGASFSGKSSRIDAVRLALIGYLPELGKKSTMQLARNGGIKIDIEDSLNRVTSREWSAKNKTGKDLSNEIPETPVCLMDPTVYFNLSDKKKIEYAFSMFDMGASEEFNGKSITAQVKNIKLEENTEDTEAAIADVVKLIGEKDFEREQLETPVQQWIEELIESMKQRVCTAKANCDRMTKTVQGITQIGATTPAQYRNPEAEIKAEREAAAKLMVRKGSLEADLKSIAALNQRKTNPQATLINIREPDATIQAQIDALNVEIETIEKAPLNCAPDDPKLQEELDKLTAELGAYKSVTRTRAEVEFDAREKVSELVAQFRAIEQQIKDDSAAYELRMAKECCAACGSKPEHWSSEYSKAKIKSFFDFWLSDINRSKEVLSIQIDGARMKLTKATDALKASDLADIAIEQKRDGSRKLQKAINEQAARKESARRSREQSLTELRGNLKSLQARKESDSTIAVRRSQATEALKDIETELAKIGDVAAEIAAVSSSLTLANSKISELEAQRKEYTKAQADQQRNAQALLEHAKAKSELDVAKATVAVLEGIQAAMVAKAFETILRTVNRVTDCVIKEPIEYREGEIGRFVGPTWVRHETFSGTEKALIFAGISLALSVDAPIKIILIDELGRMDHDSIRKVLERMVQLANDGVLSQFVGCLSDPDFGTDLDVNLIRL